MGDHEQRAVTLGRVQSPPVCVPGEIFTVYQPVIGPTATLLWLNLRWAAHVGAPYSKEQALAAGVASREGELDEAFARLQSYGLLSEADGGWTVHDPLPEELFRLRYGEAQGARGAFASAPAKPDAQRKEEAAASETVKAGRASRPESESESLRVMRSPLSKRRARERMLRLVEERDDGFETASEDMQAVVQIYHKRIGLLGPTQYEKLRFWVEEMGMEGAVVALAIEETVRSADVPRISYLEGILRNWYNDGIRTLADVHERKRASRVLSDSAAAGAPEGTPNADAYRSVSPELVAKWKELYPDEYDS